jgi:hypothetical protein
MEGNKDKPGERPAGFLAGLGELDRILRGELTQVSSLRRGGIDVSPGRLSIIIVVLGMVYGICMGTFALFRLKEPHAWQMVASMVKIPLLFYLTLLVTLPSLYVFNALVGSRLTLGTVVRLLVASLGVMVAVLASLGPIVAFFSVSTTSYPFMVLFNVVVCSVSGALGLTFLLQTLHRLSILDSQTSRTPSTEGLRAAVEQRLNELESESIPASASEGPEILGPASALDPVPNRVLGKHVQSLGGRVCPGGCPDGLGVAPIYRQPEHAVHLVPRTRFQLLPGCSPKVARVIFLTRPASPAS